jgi:predicted nucleic acid-binding protein
MHDNPARQVTAVRDAADQYLVALAVAATADFIVSGDRESSTPR